MAGTILTKTRPLCFCGVLYMLISLLFLLRTVLFYHLVLSYRMCVHDKSDLL